LFIRKYFYRIILLIFCSLILSFLSCSAKPIGYAVVLWDESEEFKIGELLEVMEESKIRKTYMVVAGGEKDLRDIEAFKTRFFELKADADAFIRDYEACFNQFAFSEKDGLPVREEAHQEAKRIYVLKAGQLVKVVRRETEPVAIGSYQDYWYRVLTEDGYEGFCFGYYLSGFESRGNPGEEAKILMGQDPLLDKLLSEIWRPEYFAEMIDKERIDLFRLRQDIGLFPSADSRTIRLVTAKYTINFTYEKIEKTGTGRYHFQSWEQKKDLRISIVRDNRIILSYDLAGRALSVAYILLDENLGEIIEQERLRRLEIFSTITSHGRVLKSSGYGDIRLPEGLAFEWTNFGRLGSQIFLKEVKGSGSVDFPFFLSAELAGNYDGIITFRFDEYQAEEGTSFLYKIDQKGIRMVFIRSENIDNLEVGRTGLSPLILYFSFGRS